MPAPRSIIIAVDSFKGCLSSKDAGHAAREAVLQVMPDAEVMVIPVSDGGEGWLEAFAQTNKESEYVQVGVLDPLHRPIRAEYLRIGDTAVIESARACGLSLLSPEERNPLIADTYGVGQLVAHAVGSGCNRLVIGLGGSGTSDAGRGMVNALKDCRCLDMLPAIVIATDVMNPLCGENGAAHVFAPQKGATPEMVEELDRRAADFALQNKREMGYDFSGTPGAGAAGGLGYALMQFLGGKCKAGADILFDEICFSDMLQNADLVITGEGSADRQTLMGKLPARILGRTLHTDVKTLLIAGQVKNKEALLQAGFHRVECINPEGLPLAQALKPEVAKENITATVIKLISQTL